MSDDVAKDAPELSDPTYLWRDLLQLHSAFPLHCLVGGGAWAGGRAGGCATCGWAARGGQLAELGVARIASGHPLPPVLRCAAGSAPSALRVRIALYLLCAARRSCNAPHALYCLHCTAGDQLYNDGVWQTRSLKEWGAGED